MRKHRSPWTEGQKTILRDLWPKMSQSEIAAEMGTTTQAVRGKAKRMGLPFREVWRSDEQKERIRALRKQGWSILEIAEQEGLSKGVVAGLSYRMGVSTPRKSRERDLRRRAPVVRTELTCDMLPKEAPLHCQFLSGNPLRFCTNKRAVIAGRVSMYCEEHGIKIKPTQRVPQDVFS